MKPAFHPSRNAATIGRGLILIALCLPMVGCSEQKTAETGSSGRLAMVGTLHIAVVDDPALAKAIERFHGEWLGQTGSDYIVDKLAADQLNDPSMIKADAIICSPYDLGQILAGDRLASMPENLRKADRSQWPKVFSLLRTRTAVWGSEVYGVPFGSPVFVCYCRADLLEKLNLAPPRTWAEYQQLAELLGDREKLGDSAPSPENPWSGALEPLGPGWGGKVLLARAAAYSTHRENYSTLFEIESMKPLIAGPPFVKALQELVAAADRPAEQLTYDPTSVRQAFWEGRCGMALTWPTAAGEQAIAPAEGVRVQFAELPGATEVYDFVHKQWERRGRDEDFRVPLLGVAGRMGVVSKASQWPDATFQLLLWLSDDARSIDVAAESDATTLERSSQIGQAKSWVESPVPPEAATAYAEQTETTLTRQQLLYAVRIPGHAEYFGALDEAVAKAVRGDLSPQDALGEAAARWDEITDRLGRQTQAEAYYASLGLY